MKKFRLSNGLANIILCIVVLLAGVLTLVNVYCWEYTKADQDYVKQLMAQGYTYQQAYDEICEIKGTADVYGTGGIDGICKYGTHASGGTGSSGNGGSGSSGTTTPKHTHVWDDGEVIKAATCTEMGKGKYTCECGKTKEYDIDKVEHTYDIITEVPATCTSYRNVTYTCSVCGDTYTITFEEEGFAEHIYIPTEDSIEPTCTEKGITYYVCNVCQDAYDEEIDALEHEYKEYTVDKPATCTENGIKSLYCIRCDEVKEDSAVEIPAKGHTEDTNHTIKAATFWSSGAETVYCRECGAEISTTVIEATGGYMRTVIPVGAGLLAVAIIVLVIVLAKSKKKGK